MVATLVSVRKTEITWGQGPEPHVGAPRPGHSPEYDLTARLFGQYSPADREHFLQESPMTLLLRPFCAHEQLTTSEDRADEN